jgi:hypothetical protein
VERSSRLTSADRPRLKRSHALLKRRSLGAPLALVETGDHGAKELAVAASNTKRNHKSLIVTSKSSKGQQTQMIPAILLSRCFVASANRHPLHEAALTALCTACPVGDQKGGE